MVSSFLVFLSKFRNSSRCKLIVPKQYLTTGIASDLIICILLFALNSVSKSNLTLLRLFPVLSSFQSMGYEPCICWGVASGNIEMNVKNWKHGKTTRLGIISLFIRLSGLHQWWIFSQWNRCLLWPHSEPGTIGMVVNWG